jgi:hypothetical protein
LRGRLATETVGTALLVAIVVGSGIQAERLSHDGGMALPADSPATVFGLGVLIALLGPVSGAHFNPVVSLTAWSAGPPRARRPGAGTLAGPDGTGQNGTGRDGTGRAAAEGRGFDAA